jgi:hypothetical protein
MLGIKTLNSPIRTNYNPLYNEKERESIVFPYSLGLKTRIQEICVGCHIYIGNEWFRVRVMVFNTTFNNISVLLWWSVLLESMEIQCSLSPSHYIEGYS